MAPIDRSGYKEQVVAFAISLGKALRAEITVIHVIDPGRCVPGGRDKEKEREEEAKREAEILLAQFVDHLARKEEANIKKEVVEESDTVAKKNNMDVIVIGTKGMTAVEDFF